MKNEIVTYKNEFNTVPLKNFRGVEMDLLFSIMSKMRNQQVNEVTLDFHELKQLSNYKLTAINSFVNDLKKTYDKLISLNVTIGNTRKFTKFVFFTKYTVDQDAQTVTIKTNEEFAYLINNLDNNFTRLELEEVTSLSSSYSKALYRQLKQYKASGIAIFSVEDFREKMCIPQTYEMYNINQKVIDVAVNELKDFFPGLKCKRIKGTGKDKRKTVKLQFTFQSDPNRVGKDGMLTFRDENKNYYEKHLNDLTNDEIDKAFPEYNPKKQ